MNTEERSHLLHVLRGHRDTIVQSWYCAIARTSFVPLSSTEVRSRLDALTDELIALMYAEPFAPSGAQAIGAALGQLQYIRPDSLSRTLDVLARELGAHVPADHCAELQPRITALLSELATGFCRKMAETILAQQEQLRAALFTERARFVMALRESEARFRAIFDEAAIGIALADGAGRIVESNPALHAMLGYSGDELREMVFTQFTHPDDAPSDAELYQALLAGKLDSYHIEKRYIRKDGRVMWGDLNVSLVRDAEGVPQYALGMIEDITEPKRVQAQLSEAQRRLAERLESERMHLARELHDSAVQQLLGISYQLIERRRHAVGVPLEQASDADLVPTLEDIRWEVLGVVSQLRSLIGELRPAGLEELGLTTALEGYVARLKREGGPTMPQIDLDLDQSGTALPQPVALCLFRSAQEALRNALKHAHAHEISVQLQLFDDEARLDVHDDGCGFHVPARLSELAQADHFGLVGIAERVAWVGGRLTIRSRPACGTDVVVRIRLNEARDNHDEAYPRAAGG